jgi:hypothetical protein
MLGWLRKSLKVDCFQCLCRLALFTRWLGAVPKSDGGLRVIHDHSVPLGGGVNDHEVYMRSSWDSLESTLQFLVPHVYMARLDVSAYYRHFMVHLSQ